MVSRSRHFKRSVSNSSASAENAPMNMAATKNRTRRARLMGGWTSFGSSFGSGLGRFRPSVFTHGSFQAGPSDDVVAHSLNLGRARFGQSSLCVQHIELCAGAGLIPCPGQAQGFFGLF